MKEHTPKEKTRLDLLLLKKGLAESREKAKAMVMAGEVQVNGVPAQKPGSQVLFNSNISIKQKPRFVSRGGLKLEAALDHFSINIKGLTLLDIGASTGGFTDCLLQRGAAKIIAIDVGYGQLHWKLRQDPRVEYLERKNARYLTPDEVNDQVDGAVIDVSFISLRLILPAVSKALKKKAFIIALVKPQFEAGKDQVGKGGVVRDETLHREIICNLSTFSSKLKWNVIGHIPSPILGPKGNREFLLYMRR